MSKLQLQEGVTHIRRDGVEVTVSPYSDINYKWVCNNAEFYTDKGNFRDEAWYKGLKNLLGEVGCG